MIMKINDYDNNDNINNNNNNNNNYNNDNNNNNSDNKIVICISVSPLTNVKKHFRSFLVWLCAAFDFISMNLIHKSNLR